MCAQTDQSASSKGPLNTSELPRHINQNVYSANTFSSIALGTAVSCVRMSLAFGVDVCGKLSSVLLFTLYVLFRLSVFLFTTSLDVFGMCWWCCFSTCRQHFGLVVGDGPVRLSAVSDYRVFCRGRERFLLCMVLLCVPCR